MKKKRSWGLLRVGRREEYVNSRIARKVDIRLPAKGNSKSHGARSVHLIIAMIKWIRTSRLSIKNSLSENSRPGELEPTAKRFDHLAARIGFDEGSYSKLIDLCITQLD